MSTEIDLSRKTGLVDMGTHTFLVTDRSSEEVGEKGPYWRLICEVISAGENQGKEIMHQISLAHKSRFVMDEFLDGIGAPKRGKWSLEKCLGKKFRASVGSDVYQGKTKSVFESIFPVESLQKSFDELDSEVSEEDSALPEDVVEGEEEGKEETKSRRKF